MLLDSCQRLLVMDLHYHQTHLNRRGRVRKAKINQGYDRTQTDKTTVNVASVLLI